MKRKTVRPEPLKVSTYFFDQILYDAERENQKGQKSAAVIEKEDEELLRPPRYRDLFPSSTRAAVAVVASTATGGVEAGSPSPGTTGTVDAVPTTNSASCSSSAVGTSDGAAASIAAAAVGSSSGSGAAALLSQRLAMSREEEVEEQRGLANAPLSSSWVLAPITKNPRVDATLWSRFTPISFKEEMVEFISLEHGRSRALAIELEEMWQQVEDVLERNKVRKAILHADYGHKLQDLQSTIFWKAEDVMQRFELDLTLPSQLKNAKGEAVIIPPGELEATAQKTKNAAAGGASPDDAPSSSSLFQQMASDAHIKLQFDMTGGSSSSGGGGPGGKADTSNCSSDKGGHPAGAAGGAGVSTPVTLGSTQPELGSAVVQAAEEQEPMDKSKAQQQLQSAADATTMARKAKAYAKSREELMDPTKRPYCLRRLFAPLLQKRDQLPKNLTLMFGEIQKCQSEVLPKLEESLTQCSMFHIPLHLPFQMISRYISRYLVKDMPTVLLESQQKDDSMSQMRQQVESLKAFILENGQDEAKLDKLPTRERHDLAQKMWQKLLAGLKNHQQLHEKFIAYYNNMTKTSAEKMNELKLALDDCDQCSARAMEQLVADAKESIQVIQNMADRIKVIVKEVESAHEQDEKVLRESVTAKEFKLQKSEAQQERLARRVREAVKEYHAEQLRYEEISQEVFQERLALAQMNASYEQLKHAVKTCYEEAIASDNRAAKIHKMLKKSEKVRSFMVTSCRQHVGRLETEDYYRRHRIADDCARNMQEWSRCLNDIVAVYEDRFEGISAKGKVSWQMNYLVAGERDWAVCNFLEGREELTKLDHRMDEIKKIYGDLDDELPPLVAPGDGPEAEKVRIGMQNIDGPLNVQRQLPRLGEKPLQGTSKQRITALMNSTSVAALDTPAGGPPNAAGRDGIVRNVDQKVKERIPREPYAPDPDDMLLLRSTSGGGGGSTGRASSAQTDEMLLALLRDEMKSKASSSDVALNDGMGVPCTAPPRLSSSHGGRASSKLVPLEEPEGLRAPGVILTGPVPKEDPNSAHPCSRYIAKYANYGKEDKNVDKLPPLPADAAPMTAGID